MDNQQLQQGIVVHRDELNPNITSHHMALFNEDGTPYSPGGPAGPPTGDAPSNLAGPFVIDASKTSGQERFDGIVLTTLESGRILHDISWRSVLLFNGSHYSQIRYLGTEDINFLLTSDGNGWDTPTNPLDDSSFELADPDVMVGEWLMPQGASQRSILSAMAQSGYLNYWGSGPFVPESGNNDLVVKIPNNQGGVDDSTVGQVEFWVHYL